MASGNVKTNSGRSILLYRGYTANADLSATQYLPPTQFKVGISNGTPTVLDTDLAVPILIGLGTVVDDGSSAWTGSNGGQNTTDNTTTFKEGSNAADATSQNLLATTGNATKTWTIAGLTITAAKPISFWIYITTASLAKFLLAGTALQLRIRTTGDAANKSYLKSWTTSELLSGWNYMHTGSTNVNGLTTGAGGAPSGSLNEAVLEIITNNTTDTFTTGDVCYDLLRQWAATDLVKDYVAGYPSFNYTTQEVTIRCYLNILEANGFLLNSLALFNEDTVPLMSDEITHESQSKSSTDEFSYVTKSRII